MGQHTRVLDPAPIRSLDAWREIGGGRALDLARSVAPDVLIELVADSGLRGRGGAGFPTGTKWGAVAERSGASAPTVVVNAAEGEPGSYKDRTLLQRNPFRVMEGALIAAHAVGAASVVVGLKASFSEEISATRAAVGQMTEAGWTEGLDVSVLEGPSSYLYGEESGLLEVVAGRQPFPRIAPPFRHGVEEQTGRPGEAGGTLLAGDDASTEAPVSLVNNVETLANVSFIVAEGAEAFRSVGTAESPGTVVCTISGATRREGVDEFALGTPLSEVIHRVGGGAQPGHELLAVMSGVSNALLPAEHLDTPLTYEDLAERGSGLGAAGFICFDERDDLVAVAHGVARFLAVESCGQCTPCKYDGVAIAETLDRARTSQSRLDDREKLDELLESVVVGARCALAGQQQTVIRSVLALFPEHMWTHTEADAPPAEPYLVAPIAAHSDGAFDLDATQADKQPDWSHGQEWDGRSPADAIDQG